MDQSLLCDTCERLLDPFVGVDHLTAAAAMFEVCRHHYDTRLVQFAVEVRPQDPAHLVARCISTRPLT
jgi:uncharacterized protein HemY